MIKYSALTGFFFGALSYWFNAYNDLNLLGFNIYYIMGISSFISAIVLGLKFKNFIFRIPIYFCLALILAAFMRIIYDVLMIDATHHNLFPFEIAFIVIVIVPSSVLGATLIFFINKLNFK